MKTKKPDCYLSRQLSDLYLFFIPSPQILKMQAPILKLMINASIRKNYFLLILFVIFMPFGYRKNTNASLKAILSQACWCKSMIPTMGGCGRKWMASHKFTSLA